jgi:serine/threonine-protein kinase
VEGTILGTLQYMAPEQLEGKVDEIDGRTDIFAFGAVVYEMATGKKAFEGKSSVSLIGAILKDTPPPISSLQPMTPPALDRVVKTCLSKDPDDRWQTARDVWRELNWIAESSAQAASVSAVAAPAKSARTLSRGTLVWVVVSLLLVAITGIAVWNLRPAPLQPVTRTVITLPPGQRLPAQSDLPAPVIAISADGSRLAYVGATQGGSTQLYLRSMDSAEVRPVPGTEGAISPFFSPDGQWLGFFQIGTGIVRKISVNGGAATPVGTVPGPYAGIAWGSQGMVVFGTQGSGLGQIPDAGGAQVPLTRLGAGEAGHRWPDVLPGGRAVLFSLWGGGPTGQDSLIAVYSIGSGERRNFSIAGSYPHYVPSGHLVYAQNGTLMAAPFDPDRLEVTGTGVPRVESVLQFNTGVAHYRVSDRGTLVYLSGESGGVQRRLVWVSRNGAEQDVGAPPQAYGYPRLSPDGRRVAVELDSQIWLYDLARETLSKLTFEGSTNQNPTWTPDGRRIAFFSNREEAPMPMYWILADGSGGPERLSTRDPSRQSGNHVPRSWSPDGQFLAFHVPGPETQRDIWVLRMSDHKAEPFLRTRFVEGAPAFSPDGRWIAYISNESGRPEIYVQPYPGPGGKWQISTEGGSEPVWNPNGRELFYRSGSRMMAVDVTSQPTFAAGRPRMLFEGEYFAVQFPLTSAAYDVTADGQRFLMVKETQAPTAVTQINVVLNWFEELKRRVPVGQ